MLELRVELILPVAYQEDRRLHYCYGVLICPTPQSCWDMIDLSIFLIPMAHGQPKVLHELCRIISEHSTQLRRRSPVVARRGTSHRGRGRGTRRRGSQAESTVESRARRGRLTLTATADIMETIDLVDDGPNVIRSSNSDNNNAARYYPNNAHDVASNGLLLPGSSEVNSLDPKRSNTLAEHSISSRDSSSKMIPSTHKEKHLAERNKFDNSQFHDSLRKRAFGPTKTNEGALPVPMGIPIFQNNGLNTRNETSNAIASSTPGPHARGSTGVPSTTHSLATNGQNQQVRNQTSNMVAPSVSDDVYSQNVALKTPTGVIKTTKNALTSGHNLRNQTSNMIASSALDEHSQNSVLRNSIGQKNTTHNYCQTNGQSLRYSTSNMVGSSASDSQVQNSVFANPIGAPSITQRYTNNSQNLRNETSNTTAYSAPDMYAQNNFQNQPTISNYTAAEHAQNFNYQNPYHRPWSNLDLQMQSGVTVDQRGMLPSSTVTGCESLPYMTENFNPANFSNRNSSYQQTAKLPSFEEAISTLYPGQNYNTAAAFNGYNEVTTLGSGYPYNEPFVPNEELNRHAMFSSNQLHNNGSTIIQPSSFYHIHPGTSGAAYLTYDSKQQHSHEDNTFSSQGRIQNNPHHQTLPYNTHQQALPNYRTQHIQTNCSAGIKNYFKLGTFIKPAEKSNRDVDYVNNLSNNPTSSKSIEVFIPNDTDEHCAEHTADNPVGLLKAECFLENVSDYDDSNELVIDEDYEEELEGHRGEPSAGNAPYPSMPDI